MRHRACRTSTTARPRTRVRHARRSLLIKPAGRRVPSMYIPYARAIFIAWCSNGCQSIGCPTLLAPQAVHCRTFPTPTLPHHTRTTFGMSSCRPFASCSVVARSAATPRHNSTRFRFRRSLTGTVVLSLLAAPSRRHRFSHFGSFFSPSAPPPRLAPTLAPAGALDGTAAMPGAASGLAAGRRAPRAAGYAGATSSAAAAPWRAASSSSRAWGASRVCGAAAARAAGSGRSHPRTRVAAGVSWAAAREMDGSRVVRGGVTKR
mmetsp:Transcript_1237/g.3945  ORF Transcript_1237/g.3945 Transcript_1237/m.3945 type:complete len:262 (+) Transcript_1237:27-812(+)